MKEPVRNYDLLSMPMICLGSPETAECDILKLLDALLSNKIEVAKKQQVLQHDFDIPMTKELERGLSSMCNLGEVIARENMAAGMVQGIAQGMAKGLAQGIITSIKNLMKNTGWPLEQVLTALEIPEEDWERYTEILADK